MEGNEIAGLSTAEVATRIKEGKTNKECNNSSKSIGKIIKNHTLTYFNLLNILLAALVFSSGQYKNATFLAVVLSNVVIGIGQEVKVKKLIDKLSVITASKARLRRNDAEIQCPVNQVVLDDVMLLKSGEQVCSDSIVLQSEGMEVNESMLTGESLPVKKKTGDHLMSGSYLVSGSGVCRVEHVGVDNYAVALAKKARSKKRASSEMQQSIRRIIKVISVLIVPVGLLLFITQKSSAGISLSDALVNTVAGVIGMIPEGLVLLTSISFILGVGRLAKKRALVQEMEAIESLARVNVLCCDKTGTITTGKLEVVDIIDFATDAPYKTEAVMDEISFAFSDVNNTQEALMERFTETKQWNITQRIPFSSQRKYRAITFETQGSFVLGAPEFLLDHSSSILNQVNEFSAKGFRVLLLGQCASINEDKGTVEAVSPLGLILITDQIRDTAKATFDYFYEQGVAIKVISGDNPITVSNIAVQAGLAGGEAYIDANDLPTDEELFKTEVLKYSVFGRVKPEQKQRIIKAYQAKGKTVAMVGDGVNDVLALKDANCGIAMAAGSDAAKEVAHIVLMDSDFSSMKNIIGEGRNIIANIEKVSALYLTKTIYSLLLSVIFIFMHRNYPFVPIQLSLISLVGIGVPSFFLALEKNDRLIEGGFLKQVLKISLPTALAMVLSLVGVQLISGLWQQNDMLTSTFNLLIGGALSFTVVLRLCLPFNPNRVMIFVSMLSMFAFGIFATPVLLETVNIFAHKEMWYVLPMLAVAFLFLFLSNKAVKWSLKQPFFSLKNPILCYFHSLKKSKSK